MSNTKYFLQEECAGMKEGHFSVMTRSQNLLPVGGGGRAVNGRRLWFSSESGDAARKLVCLQKCIFKFGPGWDQTCSNFLEQL